MGSSDFRKKFLSAAPWAMISLLLIVCALLLKQNMHMRAEMEKLQPKLLQAGNTVRAFNGKGLHDEFVSVRYTGEGPKRVLLYFKPS